VKYLLFLAVVFLSSCASAPTAYAPIGPNGGYYDFRVSEDIFVVRFSGNASSPLEYVRDLCLLRCAEVAVKNGYRYFIMLSSEQSENIRQIYMPSSVHAHIDSTSSSPGETKETHYDSYKGVSAGRSISRINPKEEHVIKCLKERPSGEFFDAKIIITSLRGLYNIPDPALGAVLK
jgi:hypothetical protein